MTAVRSTRRQPLTPTVLLLIPALVLFGLTFVLPLLRLGQMSLATMDDIGVLQETISAVNYFDIFSSLYNLRLIGNSLLFGLAVTAADLVLTYPAALFLHRMTGRWKGLLLLAALSPLFVSSIVRTYGWTLILGQEGLVNSFLLLLAPGRPPLQLLNNLFGCYVGLVQILMPYMLLSLMSGFGRLLPEHEEAAASLGASSWQKFVTVIAPLTAPGVFLGLAICFVLSISSFVTPMLLGGGRVHLLATEIYAQAVVQLEWPLAASLSVILLLFFGSMVFVYNALAQRLEA